ALERWFAPAARKLGWRTEFSWERYAEWAKRCRGMRLVERQAMPPFGHFSLIRFSKAGGTSAARADTPAAHAAAGLTLPVHRTPCTLPADRRTPVTSDSSNRHNIDTRRQHGELLCSRFSRP